MELREWIAEIGGPRIAAKMLGVERHAVAAWLRAKSSPRAFIMVKIHQLSGGKVSYETILRETLGTRRRVFRNVGSQKNV